MDEDTTTGGGMPPTTPTPEAPAPETRQPEDVSGLKTALDSERKRAKELERQFKAMQESIKDIDPEKYKKLEQLQTQAEEWNKREIDLRNQLEQDYNSRVQGEQTKYQELQVRYSDLQLRTAAEKAYQMAGGRSGAGEDGTSFFEAYYSNVRGRLQLTDKGAVEVIDGNGVRQYSKKDATKLMTPDEYFGLHLTHPVYGNFFERQQPGKGGGMSPLQPTIAAGTDLSNLPAAERLTALRQQQNQRR
jgi:hypothetical protein